MKKFLNATNLCLILFISLLVASCSKQADQMSYIPKESVMVLSFDLKGISDKAKLGDFTKTNIYSMLKVAVASQDPKVKKLVDDLLQNPSSMGIDFTKDCFVYMTKENQMVGMVMKMGAKDKFADFVKNITKEFGANIEIKEKAEASYFIPKGSGLVGWNSEVLVFMFPAMKGSPDYEKLFTALMEAKSENSITNNEDFNKFYKNKKDINCWLSDEIISDNSQFAMIEKAYGFKLKGNYLHMYLDFGQDEISLTGDVTLNEENKKKFAGQSKKDGINESLLNIIPNKSILAGFSYSIDMNNLYESINSMMKTSGVDLAMYDKLIGFSVKDLFKFFGGDFFIAMTDINISMQDTKDYIHEVKENPVTRQEEEQREEVTVSKEVVMPIFTFCASVNEPALIDQLIKVIPEGVIKKRNIDFEIDIMNFKFFAGIHNKILVVTNDDKIIDNADKGYGAESFAKNKYAELFKKSPATFFLNLKYDTYPEALKSKIRTAFPNDQSFTMFKSFADILDCMLMYSKDDKFIYSLKLAESKQNSLFTIFTTVDKNIAKLAAMGMR